MVLKVEDGSYDETKPILGSTASSEVDNTDVKLQEAYKNITSSIKIDPLSIDKPIVALGLFSTSVKIRNVSLAKQCIDNLNRQLNDSNVLFILHYLSKYKSELFDPYYTGPSAPPIVEEEYDIDEAWERDLVDNLKNNCMLVIDKNADFVLGQKEFLDLNYCDILNITTRDTLEVTTELLVYSAIMRWCIEECKRRTLQIQKVNLKAVLRDLVYAPRYGLMTKKEFTCQKVDGVEGPKRSGLLDQTETERILEYIKKKGKNKSPMELPYKGGLPRIVGKDRSWKCHSKRTNSTCDKFIINFLTCWTAIFD